MPQTYGTIISTFESPSTRKFSFVLNKDVIIHRGQFVQLDSHEGKLIGRVSDIFRTNKYFNRPESVSDVQNTGSQMDWHYPVWEHEYLVADAKPLGIFNNGKFKESTFPVSPGGHVYEPDISILTQFFGFDPNGLHLGKLKYHDVDVRLNLTKLFQKHLAILAISGSGKSYSIAVMLEELLNRKPENGQLGVVVIDPHGEYSSLIKDASFADKIKVFQSNDIRIGVSNLSPYQLAKFVPGLVSPAQTRELARIMREMPKNYGIQELITALEEDEKIKAATKDVLVSLLYNLQSTGVFGVADYPTLRDVSEQGKVSIIDLSHVVSLNKKQILVSYLASKLFDARRHGMIPPFLLVIEEAHQFAPEGSKKDSSISKSIIETIAREGRKFNACLCLISQRPVQLSTTALSQCNTNFIFRVTNPYDLKHIQESSEGITYDVVKRISSLPVGTGLIVGEAVSFPVFVDVRPRQSKEGQKGQSLEEAAKEYKKLMKQEKEDAKAFM